MNAIRKLRENANMTQEQLSMQLAVERSTVAKWETGQSVPRIEKLKKLAKLFGCTVSDLIDEDDEQK